MTIGMVVVASARPARWAVRSRCVDPAADQIGRQLGKNVCPPSGVHFLENYVPDFDPG
jgi:hypothetical protein